MQPKMKGRVCSLYCGVGSIFHLSCSLWCAAEQESGPRTRATFKTAGADSRVPSLYMSWACTLGGCVHIVPSSKLDSAQGLAGFGERGSPTFG